LSVLRNPDATPFVALKRKSFKTRTYPWWSRRTCTRPVSPVDRRRSSREWSPWSTTRGCSSACLKKEIFILSVGSETGDRYCVAFMAGFRIHIDFMRIRIHHLF